MIDQSADIGARTDTLSRTVDTASLYQLARELVHTAREVQVHFHSGERWLGLAAAPNLPTHAADRIGAGAAAAEAGPLIVDAGNDDWGTWTQVLGSLDTPVDSGASTHFDFHRMRVSTSETPSQRYLYQIALQAAAPAGAGGDPVAADVYTEADLISRAVANTAFIEPLIIQCPRVVVGTNVWMRTRAPGQATSTLSFYIGIHEYNDALDTV